MVFYKTGRWFLPVFLWEKSLKFGKMLVFLCSISILPPPLNSLSPPEGTLISFLPLDVLIVVSVSLYNRQPGCATAPYSRSLCSPFAGGKAVGLTILFPMEKSALPKKRTVGSKPPTAFFVQPMLPWGNAPLRLRMGERAYGDCASPNPATSPKNSWLLRLAWGRLVLTVRTGGGVVAVKKWRKL